VAGLYCPEFWYRFPPEYFVLHEMGFSTKVDDAATYLREAFGDTDDRALRGTTESSHGSEPHPLPETTTTIRLDRAFSEFDALLIQRGFRPRQTEEKWFICCRGNRLLIRRSWIGLLFYEVVLDRCTGTSMPRSWSSTPSGCGRWRAATKQGGILGSSTSMPNLRRGPTGGLSILRQRDSMLRR
jgi:hypothetical protein